MDFLDDIFEGKHSGHKKDHYDHHSYENHHHRHDSHGHDEHDGMDSIRPIISKVFRNKSLLTILIIGAGVVLVMIFGLILAFFPMISHALEYINKNGIKGVIDLLIPILNHLWRGQS